MLASEAFDGWKGSESLKPGDVIACNNSFLYREAKATKSPHYLAIEVTVDNNFRLPPTVITMDGRINLQFKRLSSVELSSYRISSLDDAVTAQLSNVGEIVLTLVGRVGDPQMAEAPLSADSNFQLLVFDPTQSTGAQIRDGVITLGSIADLDVAWKSVTEAAANAEMTIDYVRLGNDFENAFQEIQEAAARPVDPSDVSEDVRSILSQVLVTISGQVEAFSQLLVRHRERPDERETFNQLLRIAYNFADGARAFLGLAVGICDLKPLLSWMTIYEQVDLAHRFARLPFSMVGTAKPSLAKYRSVIAGARNQAFHDIFAFDHPFNPRLSSDAIREPELRLFREHSGRNAPALTYEDRRLVELFEGLTRTARQPVPLGFWDGNKDVMTCVVEVVRALRSALVLLAK
jgi:hypothetical protein